MPNDWEISEFSLAGELLDLVPASFQFMFDLGADGKCVLKYSREEWNERAAVYQADWEARLRELVLAGGNARDAMRAEKMLKRGGRSRLEFEL